tara:strand:+ start:386 stop:757 length:372 start_codon:yes stop_codon:yes gene_type:complete
MGLDQYANARKGESTIDEDGYKVWEDNIELGYWRKHPNLQGFMQELYYDKGGEGEFNCVDVELTLEDIDTLESTLDNEALPETKGFFFGEDSSEYWAEQDRDFIVSARSAINKGYTVVYSSWW